MFEIRYRITDDLKFLKKATSRKFDRKLGDVYGLFELVFNEESVGFWQKEPLPHEGIGSQLILVWLSSLINVACALKEHNYVALHIIGGASYFEFMWDNEKVKVRCSSISWDYEHNGEVAILEKIPEKFIEEVYWENEEIRFDEFIEEVKRKGYLLIEDIKQLNEQLLESETIKDFVQKLSVLD
jgi:hypothetical protein